MFLAPNFFLGGEGRGERPPSDFLDLHYKIQPVFDHVTKFRGDRPRELGDLVAKKRNITGQGRLLH